MTILEAAVTVLRESNEAMSVKAIYEEIVRRDLYKFGAKSPKSVLSGTLRNHIKKSPRSEIVEVSSGVYKAG